MFTRQNKGERVKYVLIAGFAALMICLTSQAADKTLIKTDQQGERAMDQQMLVPAGQGAVPGVSVCQFGAKGDGVTDDTDAIQAAINHVSGKGGGRILFPYTRTGYRIARPAVEAVDGRPCRGQLYIPFKPGWDKANIAFEGEMPCSLLYTYQVRDATPTYGGVTEFTNMPCANTFLFSDWKAPEERDPTARPWALLATVEGDLYAGKFGCQQVSIRNMEFRVPLDTEKMYPTTSAVNLQNAGRVNIQDSQFCLDKNIGDGKLGKELQANPCHVVGLMTSGDQNDDQILRNVAVQGFRYGFVLGEHVHADYLYVHNCEEGIVFHDSSHLSVIDFIVAQHNTRIITTTRNKLFGHHKGVCNVSFGYVNLEAGDGTKPAVSVLQHGVYDPENRLRGTLRWHTPWGRKEFPVEGAKNLKVSQYPD